MSTIRNMVTVFTRSISSSSKTRIGPNYNKELKNLKSSYNILKSMGEEDYMIFLHANNCCTKKYSDRYNQLLELIENKIKTIKN